MTLFTDNEQIISHISRPDFELWKDIIIVMVSCSVIMP